MMSLPAAPRLGPLRKAVARQAIIAPAAEAGTDAVSEVEKVETADESATIKDSE